MDINANFSPSVEQMNHIKQWLKEEDDNSYENSFIVNWERIYYCFEKNNIVVFEIDTYRLHF